MESVMADAKPLSDLARFGRHVQALREDRDMTREDLAARGGLSLDALDRLERGELSPSLTCLRKICGGLDILLSTLFDDFEQVHAVSQALDQKRFGRYVRACREDRELTRDEFAERCDLSVDAVGRLERGEFSPTLMTLRKICGGLDLLLSTLFDDFEQGRWSGAQA